MPSAIEPARRANPRIVVLVLGDAEDSPRSSPPRASALPPDCDRERLLDEHVLAGGDAVERNLVVQVDRREHNHRVDRIGVEHLSVVA